ncbi:MAG: hypothetical protein ACXWVD_00120 [Telluria sp.]
MNQDSQQPVSAVVVPELEHDRMMAERWGTKLGPEHRRERRIVAALCGHLQANGFRIHGLYDGEEWHYFKDQSDPVKAAMELIFNLDEASLRIAGGDTVHESSEPEYEHGILLIPGNGNMGNDIIADWSYTSGDPDHFNAVMDEFDVEQVP